MIKDKKLGLKVAENPIEALWESARMKCAERIKDSEDMLIIERAFLELCESKVK